MVVYEHRIFFVAGSEDHGIGSSCTPPPFLTLEHHFPDDDYPFSLDNTEGLADLFDFNF